MVTGRLTCTLKGCGPLLRVLQLQSGDWPAEGTLHKEAVGSLYSAQSFLMERIQYYRRDFFFFFLSENAYLNWNTG